MNKLPRCGVVVVLVALFLSFVLNIASALHEGPRPEDPDIVLLATRVDALRAAPANRHDFYELVCVREAMKALREGNYGVGACLVAENGDIITKRHNRVYRPYHRGDLHAEMNVFLATEENERYAPTDRKTQVLYTSVEPCVMCTARVIGSGVKACYWAVDDGPAGMMSHRDRLPATYQAHMKGRIFERCQCSPEIVGVASDIYSLSFKRLGKRAQP